MTGDMFFYIIHTLVHTRRKTHENRHQNCTHSLQKNVSGYYKVDDLNGTYYLPVAMMLLGLLCRINKLLPCGQGAGICIGCEYQVLIGDSS